VLGPIVPPTDDDIATVSRMFMVEKIDTFVLEFNPHPLPFTDLKLPLAFAIRKAVLNGLDKEAKLAGNHAEEKDYTLLVHGLMPQAPEIYRIAVHG
jgi:hypothetical protein